jgi:hypothetical protein
VNSQAAWICGVRFASNVKVVGSFNPVPQAPSTIIPWRRFTDERTVSSLS